MTQHEVEIRKRVQAARKAYAIAHRSGDLITSIRTAKAVDRHERELGRYLGVVGDDDAMVA